MLSLSKYGGRGGGLSQGEVRQTVPPASPFVLRQKLRMRRLRVRLSLERARIDIGHICSCLK